MAEKQLIVVVEGTANMAAFWRTAVTDYIEKIVRCFPGNELTGKKPPASNAEFSLVIFHTHGSYCGCLVQRTGWTKDVDIFMQWLLAISFSGGGFSDVAVSELRRARTCGLYDITPLANTSNSSIGIMLMTKRRSIQIPPLPIVVELKNDIMPLFNFDSHCLMFSTHQNGGQSQRAMDMQKHCILVAASNPYSLPTPVYRPPVQNLEQHDNVEPLSGSPQSYAETVAKSFAQCFISLSVICPYRIPKLTAIYTAGKRNPWAADPPIENFKTPWSLVLISENFVEARAALRRPGITSLPANQSPAKMDVSPVVPVTGPPPTPFPSANVPPATVKVNAVSNNAAANMTLSRPIKGALKQAQSKYVKIWEGNLSHLREGRPAFLTRMECYRKDSASDRFAANLPKKMLITRLISQDHIIKQKFGEIADFLVFRALNPQDFIDQLQEKKLCADIQLPSQTLLLSASYKAFRLLRMLLPRGMVMFKHQIPSQQSQIQLQLQQSPRLSVGSTSTTTTTASSDGPAATEISSNMPGGRFMS